MTKITGDVKATAAAMAALPRTADVHKRFKHRLKVRRDGSWKVDLNDRRDRLAYAEMLEPSNAIQSRNARAMQAQIPMTEVLDVKGRRRLMAVDHVEAFDRRGLKKPVRRSMHMERWSDGLLYRETPGGGMECTGKCAMSAPVIPCGNPRCEHCGEAK